ncbi:hypothetical protein [Streptomyces sp. LN549]|uniref:hypothetical protein n=1 Tax=Streptomyces sp. LN549 TaxID=3112979 RepID=UPI00371A34A8
MTHRPGFRAAASLPRERGLHPPPRRELDFTEAEPGFDPVAGTLSARPVAPGPGAAGQRRDM